MEGMDDLQMTCFQIIAAVGTAKSDYVNSISLAKEGKFDEARELIKEGDKAYAEGHDVHLGLLQQDAAGEREPVAPLILLHAEDQLISTEVCKLMAEQMIEAYERICALEAK